MYQKMLNFAHAIYPLVKTWTAKTYPTAFSYHGEQNDTSVFVVNVDGGDISLSGYSEIRVEIKFMYVCT